jgi:hypothetical protein
MIVTNEPTRWAIAQPLWYASRTGQTHWIMDDTVSYARVEAIKKCIAHYADWSDNAPEKFWSWKQFYRKGYRAVRVQTVLV